MLCIGKHLKTFSFITVIIYMRHVIIIRKDDKVYYCPPPVIRIRAAKMATSLSALLVFLHSLGQVEALPLAASRGEGGLEPFQRHKF
jgi:hypothetical protein